LNLAEKDKIFYPLDLGFEKMDLTNRKNWIGKIEE